MPDDSESYEPFGVDVLLLALATTAREQDGFEIGITVTVPGATVTGLMTGPREWLRLLGASGEGTVHEFLNQLASDVTDLLDEQPADVPPQWIYLREAQYVWGREFIPSGAGLLWRGRLGQVSSFSLGMIQ